MIYLSFLRYLRILWLNKHESDWPANIFILQKNRYAKVRTHSALTHSAIYQIQILSMIGFNLSPLPQGHGTATSNLSLAISLLPLTLPKVLSPWARTGHSHVTLFPLAWLLELQNNFKLGRFRARNSVFVITMTREHFT